MAGFHLGSVSGLILTPMLLTTRFGVKAPFVAFGFTGFLWLVVWLAAITSNPLNQSRISREEYQYIKRGNEDVIATAGSRNSTTSSSAVVPPFRLLLSKLPTWAIIVANFMNNWVRRIHLSLDCVTLGCSQ